MPPRAARSSPSRTLSDTSSLTAARRRRMALSESSGISTQERSIREPMGVLVWSSTQRRLPFFSPVRWLLVSSRLRRVAQSSSMYLPPSISSRAFMCPSSQRLRLGDIAQQRARGAQGEGLVREAERAGLLPKLGRHAPAAAAGSKYSSSSRSQAQARRRTRKSTSSPCLAASGLSTASLGREEPSSLAMWLTACFPYSTTANSPVEMSQKAAAAPGAPA